MTDPPEILPYAGPKTPPPEAERSRVGCAGAMVLLLGILWAGFFVFIGGAAVVIAFTAGVSLGLATLPFGALACWGGFAIFRMCLGAMLNPPDHLDGEI